MGVVYEYLTFDGKSSRDFEAWISGEGTFDAPERDVENIEIPGRNGDLHIDNGRYKNLPIRYPAFITKDFSQNFDAFKDYMLSQRGYKRLEDSYHPDYYRLAEYKASISPKMGPLNRAGSFDIVFDCDPRRFLKSGEKAKIWTSGGQLKNPTMHTALPHIRAYGTGTLTISSISVTVNTASEYTDIDSEIQEAYKGSISCNMNIIMTNGELPKFQPGINTISFTGFSRLEITPRWWTI